MVSRSRGGVYIRNIRLVRKHNIAAYSICLSQSNVKIFIRGRIIGNVTLLEDFQLLILDELVLNLAQICRQDVLAQPQDKDYNKGKRRAAYRQFILWHHGRLGVGVRRIIPSCCVWAIRDKFPDQYGQYIGFIPSRLGWYYFTHFCHAVELVVRTFIL